MRSNAPKVAPGVALRQSPRSSGEDGMLAPPVGVDTPPTDVVSHAAKANIKAAAIAKRFISTHPYRVFFYRARLPSTEAHAVKARDRLGPASFYHHIPVHGALLLT